MLAAGFLLAALIDLGSHVLLAAHSDDSRSSTWCSLAHYTTPGVDCPHKRDRRAPKGSFDDIGHQAIPVGYKPLEVTGVVTIGPQPPHTLDVPLASRPPTPPFHPPKQA